MDTEKLEAALRRRFPGPDGRRRALRILLGADADLVTGGGAPEPAVDDPTKKLRVLVEQILPELNLTEGATAKLLDVLERGCPGGQPDRDDPRRERVREAMGSEDDDDDEYPGAARRGAHGAERVAGRDEEETGEEKAHRFLVEEKGLSAREASDTLLAISRSRRRSAMDGSGYFDRFPEAAAIEPGTPGGSDHRSRRLAFDGGAHQFADDDYLKRFGGEHISCGIPESFA